MINNLPKGAIHVKGLHLWAHVGILSIERELGQWFSLDFSLWLDLDEVSQNDNEDEIADYSLAIKNLQALAFSLS